MNRLMLDFETLDVAECPVILSMGAVVFNETDVLCGLDIKIDQQSCLDIGCTISEDTVAWWDQQSDEAKNAAFGGTTHIRIAMEQLIQLYVKNDCQEIWSQGALADIKWVNNILAKLSLAKPWKYSREMCFRTYLKYSPSPTIDVSKIIKFTKHNAFDDACLQAFKWICIEKTKTYMIEDFENLEKHHNRILELCSPSEVST